MSVIRFDHLGLIVPITGPPISYEAIEGVDVMGGYRCFQNMELL